MAMPFASVGVCTVLWSKVLLAFALCSDHMASASSPVLRKKLFDTDELVTPVWKLRPSAIWSTTVVLVTLVLFIGPSNQSPTLVFGMYSPSMVESDRAPPTPLTWSVSMRSRTSPMIEKPDRCTLRLPPSWAYLPENPTPVWIDLSGRGWLSATSWPLTMVYHAPAPSIVTLSTTMCRFT